MQTDWGNKYRGNQNHKRIISMRVIDIFENLDKLLGFQKNKMTKILLKKLKTWIHLKFFQRIFFKTQSLQLV